MNKFFDSAFSVLSQAGRSRWILGCGASLLIVSSGLKAAETTDGKLYTQVPTVEAVVGQPAPEVAPKSPVAAPAGLQWIWGADENQVYQVRKKFSGNYRSAKLRAACDNQADLFINGTKIATNGSWQDVTTVDVKNLKAGDNEVSAKVTNQGGPAAFMLTLTLTKTDGTVEHIVTDASWEVRLDKSDEAWAKARVIAKYGALPWGDVLSGKTSNSKGGLFQVPEGFQVENLFTVPKEELGSWVNLTTDDKGRLIVSDEGDKGLCRITPPPIGSKEPTKVERLAVKMTSAHGFLYAFGSLYVCANGGPGSGLYRLRDTDGDDQFDEVVKLKELRGGGEHGPHALRLSPDGKSIYVIAGNHTKPPFDPLTSSGPQTMGGPRENQITATLPEGAASRIMPNWDEDLLLPREWDPSGHAAGILAPGGWIAKTDPDGKTWETISVGYRNPFDMAINADGELFAYDADMEYDIGMPWYRPTRVCHAVSGSEFGWRSGTGKWPNYFVDSLPAVVDIGPGSPVGVDFGYGTKFPAKYQKALFICDWTFGTMYAVHLEPQGASYVAKKEEFVARNALPLTDVTVGKDGALYFTVGGRGTQSELFRVAYVGKESTAPADARDLAGVDLRQLRQKIEQTHQGPITDPAATAAMLVPYLGHADRFIRYAARVGLERISTNHWQESVLKSQVKQILINGAVGLARQAPATSQPQILAALDSLNPAQLNDDEMIGWLRAYELTFIRLGQPNEATAAKLGAKFDGLFPHKSKPASRELAQLMVFLNSPQAIAKLTTELTKEKQTGEPDLGDLLTRNQGYGSGIAAMLANQPDKQQMHYAFVLRNLKTGWTMDQRKAYFGWFETAHTWRGGNMFQQVLTNTDNQSFAAATDAERLAIEATGARKPFVLPKLPQAKGPGRDYPLADLIALATDLNGRDFKNGQKSFAAARCVVCHRFAGDGGSTGPDLTQLAGRFNVKDLSESIVDPSKVISDQYKATTFQTKNGETITGRVVSISDKDYTVVVDPENATKTVKLPKDEVEAMKPSTVSLMPKDLLKQLNEDEVRDLMAYLLSRGRENDPVFKK